MGLKNIIRHIPIASYFIITFAISWLGSFIIAVPRMMGHRHLQKMDGILLFPVMLLGPPIAGVLVSYITKGKEGVREIFAGMGKRKWSWWALGLLAPPVFILGVLLSLKYFVSPAFTPNFFPLGIAFGIPAGFLEEIGWTGFALPALLKKYHYVKASTIIGCLWGLWHLPVIDFLGAAFPHRNWMILFFLAFIFLLTAIRIFMGMLYIRSGSLLLNQLLHTVSTGCLAVFSPSQVDPSQEALWYAVYGLVWWLFIFFLFPSNINYSVKMGYPETNRK
ncbi:MAG: hypothetical protein C5B59_20135 [Bacteroidetes bacterium]|nr:MAG: hypothetical protein C5B59_20135 [Bacteroidota bacterium]